MEEDKADLDDISVAPTADQESTAALVAVVKKISDLDNLLRLLGKGLSGAKPWQLHFSGHLAEAERLMQVFRLLIALDRSHAEIVEAAVELQLTCRRARRSLDGTRAGRTAMVAAQLSVELADSIVLALQRLTSTS